MKKITPLLILLITLIGCSKSQDVLVSEQDKQLEETPNCSDDLTNPVIFRVINELDVPVENVEVEGLVFGNLEPNETSCYLSAKTIVNTHINEFSVNTTIKNNAYNSICRGFCGTPPFSVYTYSSGKITIRIVSFEKGETEWNNCIRVKKKIEEKPIFTKTQSS